MATTKRKKAGRAAAGRTATAARRRTAKSAKATPKKAARVAKAKSATKTKPKAKPVAKAKPARAARTTTKPARAATPARAAVENAEVASLKAKFQRERSGLEKRLTEAMREIGLLRHHELRAMQFERQVAERDATIERLRAQLAELERRPSEPVYVHEVQQSLALVAPTHHESAMASVGQGGLEASADMADMNDESVDLDEFEDDAPADDADLSVDDD